MHPDWVYHLTGLLLMWAGGSIFAYAMVVAWLEPAEPFDEVHGRHFDSYRHPEP